MTKFIETSAGMISSPVGRVVTVNLDDMLSEDAARITRVILAALNDEFSDEKREACDLQATIDALMSQLDEAAKRIVSLETQLEERAKHGKEQAIEIAGLKSKNDMLLSSLEAANKTVERVREALGIIKPRSLFGDSGLKAFNEFEQDIINLKPDEMPIYTDATLRKGTVTVQDRKGSFVTIENGTPRLVVGDTTWCEKIVTDFQAKRKALDDPR